MPTSSRSQTIEGNVNKRLKIAASLLVGLLLAGTLGYALIEGWTVQESLFMTVTTIATVGYGEVHPLSANGQAFTIILIVVSMGALAFSLGAIVDFIAEGTLRELWEGRTMTRKIESLSDHHVVAGIGRVGSAVAESLAEHRVDFVVIDSEDAALQLAADRGWLAVKGDATLESVLLKAGVDRAKSLVAALPTDGGNMFVTVTAKTINPVLRVVSRSEYVSSEHALLKAGADRVTTSDVIGGRRMATFAMHPFASDFLDLVAGGGDVQFRLQDVPVGPSSPLAGATIGSAVTGGQSGVYVLGIRHPDGRVDTNPSLDTVMLPGSVLVVLGVPERIEALTGGDAARV